MRLMKAFIVFALVIFLVGMVSSFEFDNVKRYNSIEKEVTIENAFGLGSDIAKIKLDTELNVDVPRGYQKVAQFTITPYRDYETIIDSIDFYDVKKDNQQINRNVDYKYLTYENVVVNDYDSVVVETLKNGTRIYGTQLIGSHIETREKWLPFDKNVFDNKLVTVGLFTNVEKGDKVEWIPEIAGVRVDEWATWTENLNVNLISYYKADEITGITLGDELGYQDGIANDSAVFTTEAPGIINTGADIRGRFVNLSDGINTQLGANNFTINFWINVTEFDEYRRIFYIGDSLVAATNFFTIDINTGTTIFTEFRGVGTNNINIDVEGAGVEIMYTLVRDVDTGTIKIYINGTEIASETDANAYKLSPTTNPVTLLGLNIDNNIVSDSVVDELGFWNRSLNSTEISDLWNGGNGISFTLFQDIEVNLISPSNNSRTPNSTINFEAVHEVTELNLTNTTLYVWYPNTTLLDTNFTSITGSVSNVSNMTLSNFVIDDGYIWNQETCAENVIAVCSFADNNFTFDVGSFVGDVSYNSTVYETSTQNYSVDITPFSGSIPTNVNLQWNGTNYTALATASGSNYTLSPSSLITIPTIESDHNATFQFYWEIDGITEVSPSSIQTIQNISLDRCYTGTPYVNFTYKDETTDLDLAAANDLTDFTYWIGDGSVTKSLIESNSTETNYTAFCLTPSIPSITTDLEFKYSASGYPLRTFAYDDQGLTNTTTDVTLYLLSTADGIYSSISIIETSGATISGVAVTEERQFSGVWTIIGQGVTGSDGLVTFWNNPNFQHRITAVKSGYITSQVTITPSQTLYTLTLARTTENASYISDFPGILWIVRPSVGTLEPGPTNFNVTVTSTEENLENCKFELLNSSNISQILDSDTSITNNSYCLVAISYTTSADNNLFGRLSLDTDVTTGFIIVDTDFKWVLIDIDVKAWRGIKGFFSELKGLGEFGEGNKAEFSRVVFFFILMTILIGAFTYFTGVEISSPGGTVLIIWIIVLFASLGGFLTFESGSQNVSSIIEQYGFAFIFTIVAINYILTSLRRGME